jgi:hypothetical protein
MTATVELRSNGQRTDWCVCFEGNTYPFGADILGKELAEWAAPRLEAGKDRYTARPGYDQVVPQP